MDLSPVLEDVREGEGSTSPYSPQVVTPVAHQGTIIDVTSLLQQMELKRQEDREQQERAFQMFMQQQMKQIQHVQQQIQQVQQQEQIQPREERRARRRSPSVDS